MESVKTELAVERVDAERVRVTSTSGGRRSIVTIRVLNGAAADRVKRNEEAHRQLVKVPA